MARKKRMEKREEPVEMKEEATEEQF